VACPKAGCQHVDLALREIQQVIGGSITHASWIQLSIPSATYQRLPAFIVTAITSYAMDAPPLLLFFFFQQ
jgi:hypothetical protein